jgi:hypothetical protein
MNITLTRCLLRAAFPAALATAAATAQVPSPQPVALFPEPDLRVPIPANLGGGEALRLVDCDLDGDLLRDQCILWQNGDVTLAYAPEVLSSFTAMPVEAARDIARMPAAFALPAHAGRDALVVADAAGLGYVTFAASASVPGASSLHRTAITASSAWQASHRLEITPIGTTCCVLGLAADKRTVRLGQWTGAQIVDLATVTTDSDVRQMLLVSTPEEPLARIVVRTVDGLRMWSADGQSLANHLAPTPNAFGALTAFRHDAETRVAWLALSGQTWRLRTLRLLAGTTFESDVQLGFQTAVETLPSRFRPTGLNALPGAFLGQDGLVLHQNTRPWHVVLEADPEVGFAPMCGIEVPGLTMNVDNCPSVLMDLDRDGQPDVATVLSQLHCLQFALRVPLVADNAGQPSPLPPITDYDYLGETCEAVYGSQGVLDELDLPFVVPQDFLTRQNRKVQVVAWPQHVGSPTEEPYLASDLGAPLHHYLYTLPDGPTPTFTLRFPMQLGPAAASPWETHRQAFLMLRIVEVNSSGPDGIQVVWSSPPQLVGFVASDDTLPMWQVSQGFMQSLTSQQDPPRTHVRSPDSRQIGVLFKPLRIRLPSSTVTTPSPAGATTATPQ